MENLSDTDIPRETIRRITTAADQLYEECGKAVFPNVDAVRRKARVNMNDASIVMRAWRRAQTATAAPLAAAIPGLVQQASTALLEAVWAQATNIANANLQSAQAGWELERAEAEACRQQLATAFDQQSEELSNTLRVIDTLKSKCQDLTSELNKAKADVDVLTQRIFASEAKAKTAEALAEEIARRADDLKVELRSVRTDAAAEREDWRNRLATAESANAGLNNELRDRLESQAATREELGRLRGQMDALASEEQHQFGDRTPNGAAGTDAPNNAPNKRKPSAGT